MQKHILRVFEYFNFFSYPISFKNIHRYLEIKISEKRLKQELKQLISEKIVSYRHGLYTLGEYFKVKGNSEKVKRIEVKRKVKSSQKKLNNWRFRAYIKLISLFSQIKLVGLSGSISMMNAKENDDIDLFIISSKNKLWIARFLCVVIAMLMGVKRSRRKSDSSNKICLNLFFDETELNIPKFKKNYYVAHEIMQMKPIFNRENTYARFINANTWIFRIFPNTRALDTQFLTRKGALPRFLEVPNSQKLVSSRPRRNVILNLLAPRSGIEDLIENILKRAQMLLINRHRTTELITDKQLWFFPEDFENKLPKWTRRKYKGEILNNKFQAPNKSKI